MLARPRDALRFIDFTLVHPDFRRLARRETFEWLWASHGGPLHVIAPLKQPLRFLHPAFVTDADDLRQQVSAQCETADRVVSCATASFFWMPDSVWERLATLIALYSPPRTCIGVSSFNDHGEQPPYTYAGLIDDVARRGDVLFDAVLNDERYERMGAFSSHTQVRLPLVGESPELVVVRRGSVSHSWLATASGYPVRVLDSAGVASRYPGLTDEELRVRLEALRTGCPW
ncbi:MAG: hypothetical protein ACYDCQ_05815 [Dehalococcoidia bacterium]